MCSKDELDSSVNKLVNKSAQLINSSVNQSMQHSWGIILNVHQVNNVLTIIKREKIVCEGERGE